MWILANYINDFAKGRLIQLATLPLGTDSLVAVMLLASGLPADNTMRRTQYLSGVFSAGAAEANFTNYSRTSFTGAGITITVNTSTDVVTLDTSNVVITAAGGATNASLGKLILIYKPTSSTADSACPVISQHDFVCSTTGGTLTATVPSIGTAT